MYLLCDRNYIKRLFHHWFRNRISVQKDNEIAKSTFFLLFFKHQVLNSTKCNPKIHNQHRKQTPQMEVYINF